MASTVPTHLPFSPPSGEECVALNLAARYLLRAGTEAATRLLGRGRVDTEAELVASLSDSLLQGAALCDGVASGYGDASPSMPSSPIGNEPIVAARAVGGARRDRPEARVNQGYPRQAQIS